MRTMPRHLSCESLGCSMRALVPPCTPDFEILCTEFALLAAAGSGINSIHHRWYLPSKQKSVAFDLEIPVIRVQSPVGSIRQFELRTPAHSVASLSVLQWNVSIAGSSAALFDLLQREDLIECLVWISDLELAKLEAQFSGRERLPDCEPDHQAHSVWQTAA